MRQAKKVLDFPLNFGYNELSRAELLWRTWLARWREEPEVRIRSPEEAPLLVKLLAYQI